MDRGLLQWRSNPTCSAVFGDSPSPLVARGGARLLLGTLSKQRDRRNLKSVLGKLPARSAPSSWTRTSAMNADETLGAAHALELEQLPAANPPSSVGRRSLVWINKSITKLTKWIIVVGVSGVVLWRHDEAVLWMVVGALVNSANSKLLKRLINQERPLSALHVKTDPGMPSSHAQSLGYFACYATISYLIWHPGGIVVASGISALATYLAWLRVFEGFHTPAQVILGAGVGSLTAGFWLGLWQKVEPIVSMHLWARCTLYASFVIGTVLLYTFSVGSWRIWDT